MKKFKVGLLGMGNVGTGAYKTLEMNRELIASRVGADIDITKILELDVKRKRDVNVSPDQFTQNPDDILTDPEIDIVIELLGGIEPATGFMLKAMENGKHVVTANKAAIAADFDKLVGTAEKRRVMFRFEGSVGGGIPILNALTKPLLANEYTEVLGILNGTTNYILTQMAENGSPYAQALSDAQAKGFAEADPTADVEGHDVANKLSILISLVFGARVHPNDIPTEGITKISMADIEAAAKAGSKIKLIAAAKRENGALEYSVKPTLIPFSHPLAGVSNEFNAIFVKGNAVGELMFYGRGAGPLPTGSAVIGDVIEIVRALRGDGR
ncbi:MAG: homoserine dehydrogenase [Clostridiales Family XIII bacterium]|nr:homoserine dehydrogenase [Clostridiales Family XIII bacterium]